MTGFGLYCYNCHASAEKELTFSSLNNIQGHPGEPLTFRVDNSWRKPTQSPEDIAPSPAPQSLSAHARSPTGKRLLDVLRPGPLHRLSQGSPHGARGALIPEPPPAPMKTLAAPRNLPPAMVPEFYDPVVRNPKDPKQLFVTSDQCMPCHSGTNLNGNLTMMLQGATGSDGTAPLINVSPYAEWRWSPMGLAGRDPIFYAQFASEMAYLDTLPQPRREQLKREVRNLCFSCHGVMGKRQLDIDRGGQGDFLEAFVNNTDLNSKDFRYGGLARDGVSCTSCHHIVESTPTSFQHFLTQATTGKFSTGGPNELFGPFRNDEIVIDPMKHALGIEPRFSAYVKSSRLCGSCHVIDMPVVDSKTPGKHDLEQATYLEWVNSSFQTEFGTPGPNARSCQDCHMPGNYVSAKNGMQISPIQTQIAAIEDQTFPAADNRLPLDRINVRFRTSGYARHQLQGLNVFLLRMFDQFNDVLGVRKSDFMSGANNDVQNTIDNFVQQAQTQTAKVTVAARAQGTQLVADVTVANLTGHRFPSGVGFRRAFLELQLVQGTGSGAKTLWASGTTNDKGEILGPDGKPLPTEFFEGQRFQPHFSASNPITRQDQVQIYEELTVDANDQITTSFIRRDRTFKDNRLLPQGWTKTGPKGAFTPELEYYLEATFPKGDASKDPTYLDGSGTSQVRYQLPLPAGVDPKTLTVSARLYYQATPPYYLRMRFQGAPNAPATQRLKYLTENLQVAGTEIAQWKLQIASATAPLTVQ
jgi:hypothetical protein